MGHAVKQDKHLKTLERPVLEYSGIGKDKGGIYPNKLFSPWTQLDKSNTDRVLNKVTQRKYACNAPKSGDIHPKEDL